MLGPVRGLRGCVEALFAEWPRSVCNGTRVLFGEPVLLPLLVVLLLVLLLMLMLDALSTTL